MSSKHQHEGPNCHRMSLSNRPSIIKSNLLLFLVILVNNVALTSQKIGQEAPPILTEVPQTKFTCDGRPAGYYADPDAGCQSYHMCDTQEKQYSYLCPSFTLFNQKYMICDHWHSVDCSQAESYYDLNLKIGKVPDKKNKETSLNSISNERLSKSKIRSKEATITSNPKNKNNAQFSNKLFPRLSSTPNPFKISPQKFNSSFTSKTTKRKFNPTTPRTTRKLFNPTTPRTTRKSFNPTTPRTTRKSFNPTTPRTTRKSFNPTTPRTTRRFNPTTPRTTRKSFNPTTARTTWKSFNPTTARTTWKSFNPTTARTTWKSFNPTTPRTTRKSFSPTTVRTIRRQFIDFKPTTPRSTMRQSFNPTNPQTPRRQFNAFNPTTPRTTKRQLSQTTVRTTPRSTSVPTSTTIRTTTRRNFSSPKRTFPFVKEPPKTPSFSLTPPKNNVSLKFSFLPRRQPFDTNGLLSISGRGGERVSFSLPGSHTLGGIKFRPLIKRPRTSLIDQRNFTIPDEVFFTTTSTTQAPLLILSSKDDDSSEANDISFLLPPFQTTSVEGPQAPIFVSPFLLPPVQGPVILRGEKQELRTPLVVKSVQIPLRNSPFSQTPFRPPRLSFMRGNRAFFIPSAGLTPPLDTNSIEEISSFTRVENHMTMTFPQRMSFRRHRPFMLNPNCPQCHPVFLRPNECQPCVIIK